MMAGCTALKNTLPLQQNEKQTNGEIPMNSWKTTATGILAGLSLIIPELDHMINDPSAFSLTLLISGLSAMGIGFFARDNGVTSEQAGARK